MTRPRVGKLWLKKRYTGKTRLDVYKLKILEKKIIHYLGFASLSMNPDVKNMFLAFAASFCNQGDAISRTVIAAHVTTPRKNILLLLRKWMRPLA